MKWRGARRAWWRPLLTAAILLVLHAVGREWMATHRVMEVILAAGPQVHPPQLLAAASFAGIRLAVFLLLPGYLTFFAWLWTWKAVARGRGAGRGGLAPNSGSG